jgi:holo-[acyl-carrier protein] synthase
MSYRIGVDVVQLSRAHELLEPGTRPVLDRMLVADEIVECTRSGRVDASAVAGRLAIKEAVFKLFHHHGPVVPWRSIRVLGEAGTWPAVHLVDEALAFARAAGINSEISVSLSHDGEYAVAVAAATTE